MSLAASSCPSRESLSFAGSSTNRGLLSTENRKPRASGFPCAWRLSDRDISLYSAEKADGFCYDSPMDPWAAWLHRQTALFFVSWFPSSFWEFFDDSS